MLRREEDHRDHEELRGCFYRGHVRSDERSAVAVNLCDGMVSVLNFVQTIFFFGHPTRLLDSTQTFASPPSRTDLALLLLILRFLTGPL